MDKTNEYYREIISSSPVTRAEATIAWFYSGKKQEIKSVNLLLPVYADGEYDCTAKIQVGIDYGSPYFPPGVYVTSSPIIISGCYFKDKP